MMADEVQNQALSRRLSGQVLPVDKDLLARHLNLLRESATILREIGKSQREEFTTDFHIYGLAERYLQSAIESCLNLCGILVSALGYRVPDKGTRTLTSNSRFEVAMVHDGGKWLATSLRAVGLV